VTLQGRYDDFDHGRHLDHLLADYAAGKADPALAVLVEAHLEMRKDHHEFVTGLEALGGMLLAEIDPVPLTAHQARLQAILESDDPVERLTRALRNGHNGHANGRNGHIGHANGNYAANGHNGSNGHGHNGNGHNGHYGNDHNGNGHNGNGHNGNGHNGNGHGNGHADTLLRATQAGTGGGGPIVFPRPLARYIGHDLHTVPWRSRLPGLKEYRVEDRDGISASLLWIRAGKPMPHHTHEGMETTLVLCGGFTDLKGAYGRGDIAICDEQDDHRPVADDDGEDCVCFAVTDAPLRLTGPIGRIFQRFAR
jgi:anti-sigma factor ChrR (cupin superfamily)